MSSPRPHPRPRSACSRRLHCLVLALWLGMVVPSLALASPESELAFHRAVSAYGEGDLASAREGFERVLAEDPSDASALHYLALISIQQGDTDAATARLEQVVALDPTLAGARVDLASQYLRRERNQDALRQLDAALQLEPDNAPALLYRGIALYRTDRYEEALEPLERAAALDPRLANEAAYYQGLSNAYLGDAGAAAAAFDAVAIAAPGSPMGRSAASLYSQAARSARRWSLAATIGLEYDDNLRLSSEDDVSPPLTPLLDADQSKSGAGVFGLQGQTVAYENDAFAWRVGYDGYLKLYWNDDRVTLTSGEDFAATDLSQQTHVVWTNATVDTSFASFALRYDFSFTAIDLTDPFRMVHRVAPTAYVPIAEWGLFLGFYQFLYYDYDPYYDDVTLSNPQAFDRSGPQNGVGAQQFVFLPDPFNYVVVGALWTRFDSDGTEFRHNGIEASFGGEVDLPWEVSLGLLYRYFHRDYWEFSAVTTFPTPPTKRKDNEHEISFNIDRTFAGRYNLSLAGSYGHNASNIDNFDINRFIIGTYLRYSF